FLLFIIHFSVHHLLLQFFPTRRSSDLSRAKISSNSYLSLSITLSLSYKHSPEHYTVCTYTLYISQKQGVLKYMLPLQSIINKKLDRKSTRLNSSNVSISYAVFCL